LPDNPSVPNPPNEPDTNIDAPISHPPVQSPIPLLTDAGVSPPSDADTSAPDAIDLFDNPQPPPRTEPTPNPIPNPGPQAR